MLKHIVMFKLKDEAEGAGKESNINKVMNILKELPANINEIKIYEVGENISASPSAFDLVLYSGFDNEEALNAYRSHPEHVKALDVILKLITETAVVDYKT